MNNNNIDIQKKQEKRKKLLSYRSGSHLCKDYIWKETLETAIDEYAGETVPDMPIFINDNLFILRTIEEENEEEDDEEEEDDDDNEDIEVKYELYFLQGSIDLKPLTMITNFSAAEVGDSIDIANKIIDTFELFIEDFDKIDFDLSNCDIFQDERYKEIIDKFYD